ncbi:hypothetical protein [Limimaricola sp. AA108-03]|uniref:hypothetical protein n=1 Tax=Limimaricola sp. AA108-03 TaxID=3425945 RepID=UPI003D77DBBF
MSNGKFRISESVAELTKQLVLTVPAQKLFYALIHEQDQEENGWRTGEDWMEFACRPCHRHVSRFRALGCAPRADNLRFFQNAVPALAEVPALFEHIELCPRRRTVSWCFGLRMHALMSDMNVYGLMTLSDITLLSRDLDLALLAQITLHRKKKWPEFILFQPNPGFEEFEGQRCPPQIDLRATRARLEPALSKWARHTGYKFIIGYEEDRGTQAYRQARIRFRTDNTLWSQDEFKKFHPNTKVIMIDA